MTQVEDGNSESLLLVVVTFGGCGVWKVGMEEWKILFEGC